MAEQRRVIVSVRRRSQLSDPVLPRCRRPSEPRGPARRFGKHWFEPVPPNRSSPPCRHFGRGEAYGVLREPPSVRATPGYRPKTSRRASSIERSSATSRRPADGPSR
jgi:hypothetical protein